MNQKPVNHTLSPEHLEAAASKIFELILVDAAKLGRKPMDIALQGLKSCMDEGNDNMIAVCKQVCKLVFEFEHPQPPSVVKGISIAD